MALRARLIPDLPPSFYYVPNFINEDEERKIQTAIAAHPQHRWTLLTHRRLLSLPSLLTGTKRDTLLSASLPAFLDAPILPRLKALSIFEDAPHKAPNHCLVNEYQPGEGIMPHEDGPAYHPITATVSLGSHTVLEIYEKNEAGERQKEPRWRILQEPRSLLVTTDDAYRNLLHGIADIVWDDGLNVNKIANWDLVGDKDAFANSDGWKQRETRVSLTYRDVLKVSRIGDALKFMAKR